MISQSTLFFCRCMDVDDEPELEEAKGVGTRESTPPGVPPPAGPSEPKKRRRPMSEAERHGSVGSEQPSSGACTAGLSGHISLAGAFAIPSHRRAHLIKMNLASDPQVRSRSN